MFFNNFTITKTHQGLLNKEFSTQELTRAYLQNINEKDKRLNAFITTTEELAIESAKRVDKKIARGEEIGLLEGVPVAIKDNIMIKGIKTTAASKILKDYIASYDAHIITKLKEQNAVFLGKTNMDEFAMGGSTENSGFYVTKNPHDISCVPGGSSGGSAAAVADDMCVYALGSDTGGSIRQPASFCGVVGLKPTYGSVSRSGLLAMASSLDQIGPVTKTVEDLEIVFKAIADKDIFDSTNINYRVKNKTNITNKKLTIGIPKEYFIGGIDKSVDEIIKRAICQLEEFGYNIKEVSLPHTEYTLATYYIIITAEISANLARYDGVRYGYSERLDNTNNPLSYIDIYRQSREYGFGNEVKRRIMLGTYVLSGGYYDAYYLKAQKVRTLIRQDFDTVFKEVDCLLTPTSPTPAFNLGEKINDPLTMYLADIFTVAVNLAGVPAISVPCGYVKNSKGNNLPVGLQIIGKQFSEDVLFEVGRTYETISSHNT